MKFHTYLLLVLLLACSKPKSDQSADAPKNSNQPARADDAVVVADQLDPDTLKGSLRAKAEGSIGDAKIQVRYHSPAVRGRIVWGGLVPFDRVWVTGAHMATSLEIDKPFAVAGKQVPAGKYGFFTIPGKDSWILVINSNWEQHLTDEYEEGKDILRLVVKPATMDRLQERLQYRVTQENETRGFLKVRWEKLELSLPIEIVP